MKLPENELIVLDIAGTKARVACDKPVNEISLLGLGFVREGDQLVRHIVDDDDRKGIVLELIKMGAIFAGGRDWSPAELVDFYREQRFVTTGYRTIAWQGPEKYTIILR